MGNRAQIKPGSEQVNRRAVPQNMGMNTFPGQGRIGFRGALRVSHQNEPCAESCQPAATMIAEQRPGLVERQPRFVNELVDEFCRLRPQRADAFLSSFCEDLDGCRRDQANVGLFSETTS